MAETLCEMRFDIPLPPGTDSRCFERAWRAELAAQKLTALAMPPAAAVTARFRTCGADSQPALEQYLAARLAALPGNPEVAQELAGPSMEWTGVKIWLAYRAADLTALLQKTKSKTKSKTKNPIRNRGHRR